MSKSLASLHMFQDWYAKGNRMPENQTILYYDIECCDDLKEISEEELKFKMNLMWFMITYCGGYPHAMIVEKNT